MSVIRINLGTNSYDIIIKKGILSNSSKELNLKRKVLVVSDDGVPETYIKTVINQCDAGYKFIYKAGEGQKTLDTYQKILDYLLYNEFSRKDCVVALGGGITGDMAGFAAASYMRGIDFYNIPTTVLSQVDSSIGGKTAVNLNGVKNIVGAFYQPKKVLIDTDLLKTLPVRQISNGLAEALKMAVCFDKDLFNIFKNKNPFDYLEEIIEKSLLIKKNVVEQDEKESGLRKVLNYGHTIGHGIESTLIDERTLYHGECVSLGMIPMCSDSVRQELINCFHKLNLPIRFNFDSEKVCNAIIHDKKSNGTTISTVYVPEIAKFEFKDMEINQLKEKLSLIQN